MRKIFVSSPNLRKSYIYIDKLNRLIFVKGPSNPTGYMSQISKEASNSILDSLFTRPDVPRASMASTASSYNRRPRPVIHIPKPDELSINKQIKERRERHESRGSDGGSEDDDPDNQDPASFPDVTLQNDRERRGYNGRNNLYCHARRTTVITIVCGFCIFILVSIVVILHFYYPHHYSGPNKDNPHPRR